MPARLDLFATKASRNPFSGIATANRRRALRLALLWLTAIPGPVSAPVATATPLAAPGAEQDVVSTYLLRRGGHADERISRHGPWELAEPGETRPEPSLGSAFPGSRVPPFQGTSVADLLRLYVNPAEPGNQPAPGGGPRPGSGGSQGVVHDLMSSRDLHEVLRSIRLDPATTELVTSVLVPSIDAQQRIHFSVLGYGDFLLMQSRGEAEPGPATNAHYVPDGLGGVTTQPTGSRDSGGRDGSRAPLSEEPMTVSAFLRALLADFLDFAINPLTLLVVGLLGSGYLAAQVALAREHGRKARARQRSKAGHASHGRHGPSVVATHGAGKS